MANTEDRSKGEEGSRDERPIYEPPRLEKRRSLARVTGQVSGNTPSGSSASGPDVTGPG